MPWKECNQMEERLRFVARLLDGEKMAPLCRDLTSGRRNRGSRRARVADGRQGYPDRNPATRGRVVCKTLDRDQGGFPLL